MMYGPVQRDRGVSGLSTKHVVLGLLIERPGYGYDLIQRARSRFGFLGLSENFVYRTLERLDPDDLPELLAVAESQAGECIAELATLRRPVLAHVAEPTVPWQHAAVMMVDDLNARWLQALVDWLSAICELIEERIERSSASAGPLR